MKITLLVKTGKPTVREVLEYVKTHFADLSIYQGKVGDPFPKEAFKESPDILISYISPWIVPKEVLSRTKLWNINFHPGPPEYPGIGCLNFAIYHDEEEYGVTAHLMEAKVDTGKIIGVKRFPLLKTDSVYSLSIKSYGYMFPLFLETMDSIISKKVLPECSESWKRQPYKRKELEELCKIRLDMTQEEVHRRIRATSYPGMPGAYIEFGDFKFEYNPNR
jgi:methionyl-tRNA formyltransferase